MLKIIKELSVRRELIKGDFLVLTSGTGWKVATQSRRKEEWSHFR